MAKKEQRMTVTHTWNENGTVSVSFGFYPPLAKSKADFEAMPVYKRALQNAAADSGKGVIESLNKRQVPEALKGEGIKTVWVDEMAGT